ncbi:bifunctional adenosylcobinamide kinase/adenosylcobinamide-phosphate guanylyltransferase [Acinetobacter rudis]|uniref:Bifunctional adenosylcobalamin biosynthesis protein n=1 Tax=Acinetobacter rudis TaxID=632955 RepID=A0AAW8JAF0_9GAMM|nr:bifunctional adenosylcobinamide kinase/adenosylcobinamide-phosphate guanylyltransferase [Acinetobacter rudis]MDQ8935560.1 bifunctional adenosylcobinamide kinase/adenosylcobinamide-phosphate guanylyltransferase [Acinetobacter rudis]MDQ8953320.1 bifunctional adenosylcobinamide kinase/adenosylcobinamide-phosphate guanylyltransferase [Acinetobacter rudis]MDQ9017823.1 bifunctional adenosylcobinamide kinase/adenosylcobinamide-phosphate guanylyltransferase [Acinetobacter rudis]
MLQFILGGARSGKSRYAEQIALAQNLPVIYVATAQALDAEMQQRILHHQQQRPADWSLVESPLYLADELLKIDCEGQVILVDCLTLWMSNLLLDVNSNTQGLQCEKLLAVLPKLKSHVILVSNETGLGVVPMGQLSRQFVDESGRLHQQIVQLADTVTFCVAGLPMQLKGE